MGFKIDHNRSGTGATPTYPSQNMPASIQPFSKQTRPTYTMGALVALIVRGAMLLLPLSHLALLPKMGTTRPATVVLLSAAIVLLVFRSTLHGSLSLPRVAGWHAIRLFLLLLAFATISAIATVAYGNYFQAALRLIGYFVVFSTLYVTAYGIERLGLPTLARWVVYGYGFALLYGIIEIAAIQGSGIALSIVGMVREHLIVDFPWVGRMALFATEASFLAFQCVLLIYLYPKVRSVSHKVIIATTIFAIAFFSLSIMVILCISSYLVLLAIMRRGPGAWIVRVSVLIAGIGFVAFITPYIDESPLLSRMIAISSDTSFNIRWSYILNQIYVLWDTYGIGLGVGQYGQFWTEYYIRHIDYSSFDLFGEVHRALSGVSGYMKTWSVTMGIGVDLGVVGLIIFMAFLYAVYRSCITAHDKAAALTGVILITNSYPIVTPHVWIMFAMILADGDKLSSRYAFLAKEKEIPSGDTPINSHCPTLQARKRSAPQQS